MLELGVGVLTDVVLTRLFLLVLTGAAISSPSGTETAWPLALSAGGGNCSGWPPPIDIELPPSPISTGSFNSLVDFS